MSSDPNMAKAERSGQQGSLERHLQFLVALGAAIVAYLQLNSTRVESGRKPMVRCELENQVAEIYTYRIELVLMRDLARLTLYLAQWEAVRTDFGSAHRLA